VPKVSVTRDAQRYEPKKEVLNLMRRQYARAGAEYKGQLLDQVVKLLGYHRKAAIRALRAKPTNQPP